MSPVKHGGMTMLAILFIIFLLANVIVDRASRSYSVSRGRFGQDGDTTHSLFPRISTDSGNANAAMVGFSANGGSSRVDHEVIQMPYAEYAITQGLHGHEYGHLAIDITAGKGAEILSPINGLVMALFTDQVGSTILIIENERWLTTLVHGLFTVEVGQFIRQGQLIGFESNRGNTVDMNGLSCMGRDCGYHTHINFFDKQMGMNLNLLELIPK